jgi:hypothetical protein
VIMLRVRAAIVGAVVAVAAGLWFARRVELL